MSELATTIAIILVAFAMHVAIWRVRRPSREVRGLLLSGGFTCACVVIAAGFGWWPFPPKTTAGWVQAVIGGLVLWLAYTEFYLAVKNESPSSRMLLYVSQHPEGVSAERLLRVVSDAPSAGERLDALVEGGLIQRSDVGLSITPTGRKLTAVVARVRRFYALPEVSRARGAVS